MVTPKAVRTDNYLKRDKPDELWLLAVGEHRLSQTIPPFMLDKLNSFGTLNKKLQESGFARVFLYQYVLDVMYEWPGWKKHGEENFIPTIDEFKNKPNGESGYRDREEPHSSPLPHHAAYGSVLRGSADQASSAPGERKPK